MRMPAALRNLDDRFLGSRGKKPAAPTSEHPSEHPYPDEPGREATSTTVVERDAPRRRGGADAPPGSTGDGLQQFLAVFTRVARLVFLLLALTVGLGILFTLTPANEDNAVVSGALDIARGAAGPFRDVFTVSDDADRELVVNYAFAAGVYLLAASLVTRLPGTSRS